MRSFFPTRSWINRNGRAGSLNVTNDAWFGGSAGPYQHFHQAQLRAVEQGLPVVRAANTGISAIIDPYGRVLGELELKKEGVVDGLLPEALPTTKFVTWERSIEIAVLVFALLGWLFFGHLPAESKAGPRAMNGFAIFANASHREQGKVSKMSRLSA